jgi:phospholipase/carboxylesterase
MTEPNDELADATAALLRELLRTLDAFAWAQRRLHPPWAARLVEALAPFRAPLDTALTRVAALEWPEPVRDDGERLESAAAHALDALDRFAAAASDPTPAMGLYRGVRRHLQAVETLYPLWPALPPVNRFFLEEGARDDASLIERLLAAAERRRDGGDDAASGAEVGILHDDNDRRERGGVSLYVPEHWDPSARWPLVVALHGGSGHGADFLWTWLREARSRGFLVLSPTAVDDTWSLLMPQLDGDRLAAMVEHVATTWNVDRSRVLLTGISDGATFSLCYGLREGTPFTHLAPISGVLAPLDPRDRAGAVDKPIYLVHGALDWMFPVAIARMAHRELERWGAQVTYREIEDLSHTYPREENARILEWMDRRLAR